ncbi:MAG TPA: aminotransferase class I/II-fold pyridoxal phosphate-dependent enzyme [Terriglobia bacterium]|nr:aminotransferase class I/II-fold pyridoxal phosphate-dependent enzyme [Terriglobia bacterium]
MKRRAFLSRGALASVAAAGFHPRYIRAAQMVAQHGEIYRKLGVRPLINAAGTYTILSGSLMPERTRRAMEEAARSFVRLEDLQKAVGERIAKLLGVESAMVTSGGAGSILLATAACVTGNDPEKVRRIPNLEGMKSQVIVPRQHRNGFDHAARTVGVKLVEVDTLDDLHHAIGPQTAMLYFTNIFEPKGQIKRQEFIAAGRQAGIPVFNDAAAELPPASNLSSIVREGFDLVGFSGGKGIRGPQCSGLLLGRKELIQAALLNNNPNEDAIGRPCKVGKEEMLGLLAALEEYVQRDHEADMRLWQGFMESVARDLSGISTLTSEVYVPGPGEHPIPYLRVRWDPDRLNLKYADCAQQLRDGDPSIEVNAGGDGLNLASYNLYPGEERIVGFRLRGILREAARRS